MTFMRGVYALLLCVGMNADAARIRDTDIRHFNSYSLPFESNAFHQEILWKRDNRELTDLLDRLELYAVERRNTDYLASKKNHFRSDGPAAKTRGYRITYG